ncbi:MAG: hypothetical protein AB9858_05015 [Acidaminococcaceae bacterium]
MKKITFELFGQGQYMYMDIGRFIELQRLTGKTASEVVRNAEMDLDLITKFLTISLRHHGLKDPKWYADKIQALIEEGCDIEQDIQIPIAKCIAGSMILGKKMYYDIFPEEMTPDAEKEILAEKN